VRFNIHMRNLITPLAVNLIVSRAATRWLLEAGKILTFSKISGQLTGCPLLIVAVLKPLRLTKCQGPLNSRFIGVPTQMIFGHKITVRQ